MTTVRFFQILLPLVGSRVFLLTPLSLQSRRLIPALIVTLITLGLCYIYAESYQPPQRSDRIWPNVYPAAATAIAIIGINVGICILWKCWPPSWRMLNRYFISVPVYPHPLSLVGSIFSHQTFKHLAVNMTMLWFIGTRRKFIFIALSGPRPATAC